MPTESATGTLNQKTHCQPTFDERAAEDGADDEADGGDHRVRPHGEAELAARERVGDDGGEEFAKISAPATPWSSRQTMSSVPLPAKPAPSEAAAKSANPAT